MTNYLGSSIIFLSDKEHWAPKLSELLHSDGCITGDRAFNPPPLAPLPLQEGSCNRENVDGPILEAGSLNPALLGWNQGAGHAVLPSEALRENLLLPLPASDGCGVPGPATASSSLCLSSAGLLLFCLREISSYRDTRRLDTFVWFRLSNPFIIIFESSFEIAAQQCQ